MEQKYSNRKRDKQACLPKPSQRRQVAYEVGYSNLSYFSKAFKEKYGVLLSEYGAKIT
ncbi:MAG TPA: AraC family transcriptional regulator [Chryseolinea sp.]